MKKTGERGDFPLCGVSGHNRKLTEISSNHIFLGRPKHFTGGDIGLDNELPVVQGQIAAELVQSGDDLLAQRAPVEVLDAVLCDAAKAPGQVRVGEPLSGCRSAPSVDEERRGRACVLDQISRDGMARIILPRR